MSKLTTTLLAGLFASSLAFAADAPKTDVKTPEANPTATAPAKGHAHKHHVKQAKHAKHAKTAAPATK
ncbi:MAG: hypothetical protein WC073_10530 [Sterolibacterium sp.]